MRTSPGHRERIAFLIGHVRNRTETCNEARSANLLPGRTTRPSTATEIMATIEQGIKTDGVDLAENCAEAEIEIRTVTTASARQIIELTSRKSRQLMVDPTILQHVST